MTLTPRGYIRHIVDEFGGQPLSAVRPSQVKTWIAKMSAEGMAEYDRALIHGYLSSDSRRRGTRRPTGQQPVLTAHDSTSGQAEDVLSPLSSSGHSITRCRITCGRRYSSAAFVGLRVGEVCGLRVTDVDFIRGIVHPRQQYTVARR